MLEIKPELVTITDDKKEKYQSWEASVSCDRYPSMGIGVLELTGYGDCEQEARENLNLIFFKLIESVTQINNVETNASN